MLLSDGTIRRRVAAGEIAITPWEPNHVEPAGVDLRLAQGIWIERKDTYGRVLDPWGENFNSQAVWYPHHLTEEGYVLEPHECILAGTYERVKLPSDVKATADGRSSIGRLFIQVHSTAGFIDPGWDGHITLEISNQSPWGIRLRPFRRICQLSFVQLDLPAERPYGHPDLKSRYQGQQGAVPSRITND